MKTKCVWINGGVRGALRQESPPALPPAAQLPRRNRETAGGKGKKKECQHILTCCSIFVNIVNHGLADGNVNCTCGSNKTSRLITFTNSDRGCGAVEDSPSLGRKVLQPCSTPSALVPPPALKRQRRCSPSQSPPSLRKPHWDPVMDLMERDFFQSCW